MKGGNSHPSMKTRMSQSVGCLRSYLRQRRFTFCFANERRRSAKPKK
jgi:hypothetical protein